MYHQGINNGSVRIVKSDHNWSNKYGGTSATGGTLLADGNVPGSNTPAPAVSGSYLINVDFLTGKYTVTKQ